MAIERLVPRIKFTPAAASPDAVNPTSKGTSMNWLLIIFNLIPVIAQGINTLHADKSLATKSQMASDSLNLAIAGAKAALPAGDQATVDGIAPVAQSTLATVLGALHTSGTPAVPPSTVPAAA
jgi:hypothetical protein